MSKDKPVNYHLAGIAGVGMSALAEALCNQGSCVTGSDRFFDQNIDLSVFNVLRNRGIQLYSQDGSGIHSQLSALVISTALESDNPEIQTAKKQNVPILHRAEVLAKLVENKRCIAVAGTAGKTTVTALIGWVLEQAGWDPNVVNGGALIDWMAVNQTGNVRDGSSPWWVIEVDESDGSLLQFFPEYALITNISKDHFEEHEVLNLFQKFSGQVKNRLLCDDSRIKSEKRTFGSRKEELSNALMKKGGLRLAGKHNLQNALQAAYLCEALGIPTELILSALATFRGVARRLEKIEEKNGVLIFDDYAHNPEKIRASISAVRPLGKRIICVWRPHGFSPLSLMRKELIEVFSTELTISDHLFILPVFYVGGSCDAIYDAQDFSRELDAECLAYPELGSRLSGMLKSGDVLLLMGARDPELPRFARSMAQCL